MERYVVGLVPHAQNAKKEAFMKPCSRLARQTRIACLLLLCGSLTQAAESSPPRFKAVAFDYFVLFDPNSVVEHVEKEFPGRGLEFTRAWRAKQFEYGFLRSITDRHADFFEVTGDALDYTAQAMQVEMTSERRARLLHAYLALKPWPDTVTALRKLKAGSNDTRQLQSRGERHGDPDCINHPTPEEKREPH